MLHYISLELSVEEKEHKQLIEKEAQKSQASTSSMPTDQVDDHGKDVIDYPPQPQPSSTLEALMRLAEINKSLERMSSVVEA